MHSLLKPHMIEINKHYSIYVDKLYKNTISAIWFRMYDNELAKLDYYCITNNPFFKIIKKFNRSTNKILDKSINASSKIRKNNPIRLLMPFIILITVFSILLFWTITFTFYFIIKLGFVSHKSIFYRKTIFKKQFYRNIRKL